MFCLFSKLGPSIIRLTAYNTGLFQTMTLLAFAGHSILFNLHWRSQEGALYSLGLYKHLSKEWSVVIVGLFQQNLDVYSKEACKHLMLALPTERTPTLCLLCVSMFVLFNTC